MAEFHRFNDALEAAADWLNRHRSELGEDALLLRSEAGTLYVYVPKLRETMDEIREKQLDADFRDNVGNFAAA